MWKEGEYVSYYGMREMRKIFDEGILRESLQRGVIGVEMGRSCTRLGVL